MRYPLLLLALVFALCPVCGAAAAESPTPAVARPVYVTLLPNVRDFKLFASGGGDGNWHVGGNTCWVVKLPTAPADAYARAFLGARLGRAKTEPVPGSPPWVRRPIEGEIDIAVASEAVWPESRRFKLADTTDIPTEGDSENTSEDVGEARWFWAEIPVSLVDLDRPNYVALFSPSASLADALSSPILAGGRSAEGSQAWLSAGVHGQPPLTPVDALRTQIPNFAPGIALKLVPVNDHAVAVRSFWANLSSLDDMTVGATALGQDIEEARLEVSKDNGLTWAKYGRPLWDPPYFFRYKPQGNKENVQLRVTAADIWGNRGLSSPLIIKDGQKYLPSY
jgi:hypothetical protein